MTSTTLLEFDGVGKSLGSLRAIDNVSFTVNDGEIVGLIGPNGAGKTTLLSKASGFLKPTDGQIRFQCKRVDGFDPPHICCAGLVCTFQIVKPLATHPKLLLLDEVMAGLTSVETAEMLELIQSLRVSRVSILFIEHNMKAVMSLSNKIVVIQYGKKIAEGTPVEVANDPLRAKRKTREWARGRRREKPGGFLHADALTSDCLQCSARIAMHNT